MWAVRNTWLRNAWAVRALWTAAALVLAAGPVAAAGTGTRNAVPERSRTAAGDIGCAGGTGTGARCWPVTGPGARGRPEVLRAFDPPPAPWAAGHRGVDLRAGPGAAVRSAAPGTVAFVGAVAGTPVVVVRLAGGLRTTYEPVRASLPVGTRVAAGTTVGVLAGLIPHCAGPCLHWGLLLGAAYLDPLTLLPESLLRPAPSRLLPLGSPLPQPAAAR